MRDTVLIIAAFLGSLFLSSCGDSPLEPLSAAWVREAVFPSNVLTPYAVIESGEQEQSEVFIAAETVEYRACVLEYRSATFETTYLSPRVNSAFEDVYLKRSIWAGGVKEVNGTREPLLAWNKYSEGWEEIPLPALAYATVSGIPGERHGGGGCWLLFSNHTRENYGVHAGALAAYENGDVHIFDGVGSVTVAIESASNHYYPLVFAVEYTGDVGTGPNGKPGYRPGYQGRGKTYVSADNGSSWTLEQLPETIGGRRVHAAEATTAAWASLYLIVYFDDGASGIVRRYGEPGNPAYELAFLSYQGPYFHELELFAMCLSDEPYGITNAALGAGELTTVVLRHGQWYVEPQPYPLDITALTSHAGNGFVAVGKNTSFNEYELLYHP